MGSYFSSPHSLVEVARVAGIKASTVQIQERLLQIAGEGKQRRQGAFSSDPAPCSEASGSYFPHLSVKRKVKPTYILWILRGKAPWKRNVLLKASKAPGRAHSQRFPEPSR